MVQPTWYPTDKQLRQFAVISLFGFGLFGAVVWWKTGAATAAIVLWIIGGATFLVGLPAPRAIQPVYTLLMAITYPIGWLISNIVLRVIFYGVMTPIGLVFRIMGRDPLRLKRPNVDSYWTRFEQPSDPASYYRQA